MVTSTNAPVLQVQIPSYLQDTVASFVAFLPRLVGALLILVIGWILGVAAGKVVSRLSDSVELDRMVLDTPLGRILGGTERAVANTFGAITKWFVVGVSLLAAANVLAIPTLSRWIGTAVSYLPAFIAGLLVIVLGFVVADFIGDAIMRTRAATQTAYTQWFATGTRMFLYFTAIVIGLDTMGIDVGILYVFARAIAWGIAAAIAIGAGIAIGWGAHGYVADNVDRWMRRASSGSPTPRGAPQSDGGEPSSVERSSTGRSSGQRPREDDARRTSSDRRSDGGEQTDGLRSSSDERSEFDGGRDESSGTDG